jgi:DNA invertase Pin-like site-specific DNA recombinase
MTAAYSYTRFSTPEQAEGTSKLRQDAMVASWLKANPGYDLDTSLSFHDAGVSAFRGRNAKVGKLAAFLKLIEQGKVAPGSVLLVEEWSRFSRQNPYDGAPVSRQIFDAGVGIVDLRNNLRYDATTMRDQVIRIRLDLEWERAHRESEEKSIRMQAAWADKRNHAANGVPMTRTCPAWLELRDGKYQVIEQRAATVRLIFEMKAAGVGPDTIARRLNAMPDAWHPEPHAKNKTGGWWPSYIEKITRNRAVLGEFASAKLSDPIAGYFPAVVDSDLWNRVQARIARNAAIPGHGASHVNGVVNNIFGGLCRCARCGGTMAHINKGLRRPTSSAPSQYLMCEKARRGLGCNKTMVNYTRLESLLLHLTRGLNPADLLSDESGRAHEVLRRQALDGELAQIQRQVANLADQIANTDSAAVRQILDTKLAEKLARKAELEQELRFNHVIKPASAEAVAQHLQSVDDLITKMEELSGDARGDLRRRLRSALHELIARLEVKAGAHESRLRLIFRDGAELYLVLDAQGALRLAQEGAMLYTFDEHGNVVDVAQDQGEDAAERQRKASRLVAKALRSCRVRDHMAS